MIINGMALSKTVVTFFVCLRKFFCLFLCFCFISCNTNPSKESTAHNDTASYVSLIPDSEYYILVEEKTRRKAVFDGLTNTLDASATILDSPVTLAQVDHYARVFQYDESQYRNEFETAKRKLSENTEIFLSLFVPNEKFDNLDKKNNRWKVFLTVAGQRYEPQIIKMRSPYSEVKSLYPHHSRWGTPYRLIFPVPTSTVETKESVLTITGPLASTSIKWP